ncbi:MAG TPA: metal-dependent hydrolase [Frankiaceae bacterium]|nr:metal-dependent hydrolase [Frankiaceae bacterium]
MSQVQSQMRVSGDSSRVGSSDVPKREMEFEQWVADLPKYFAENNDIVLSHILAVLSSTFPEGENFFVRSVAAVQHELTDPTLLADVDGFIGQEEMHGREHRVLNERFAELGYPTRGIGSYVKGLYWVRERMQTKLVNLAFTAALEHYTATLAELLLTNDDAREAIGRRGARDILTWHALEESEHKAVAFDVYKAMGGKEPMRIIVMLLTDLLFIFETSVMAAISIAKDPNTWRHPLKLARSFARLPKSPFLSLKAARMLAQYHRPGFHPDDRDTKQLIAEWREALFGDDGELTQLLAS